MKRIDENTIAFTQEELNNLHFFIDNTLESKWDHYTDNFICTDSWEEGKRRMNPEMYDMAQEMMVI